jgi:hypothetical protein
MNEEEVEETKAETDPPPFPGTGLRPVVGRKGEVGVPAPPLPLFIICFFLLLLLLLPTMVADADADCGYRCCCSTCAVVVKKKGKSDMRSPIALAAPVWVCVCM